MHQKQRPGSLREGRSLSDVMDLRRLLWMSLLVVLLLTVPLAGTWWTVAMLPAWAMVGLTAHEVWSGRVQD